MTIYHSFSQISFCFDNNKYNNRKRRRKKQKKQQEDRGSRGRGRRWRRKEERGEEETEEEPELPCVPARSDGYKEADGFCPVWGVLPQKIGTPKSSCLSDKP